MEDTTADGGTDAAEPEDDLRRKFREALDRKNHASHASAAEAESTGKAVAGHTNAKTQRMFRRKSGG
jgi:uncharacterized phage protein gp47/JayE